MRFERMCRTIVFTVVVAIFFCGTIRPCPARAVDTTVLIIGSVAAYIGVVVAGTVLMRRSTPASWGLMPTEHGAADERPDPGARLGHRCRQTAGNLTLVCW